MRLRLLPPIIAAAVLLAACGNPPPATSQTSDTPQSSAVTTPAPDTRPSSPALVSIVSPTANQVITGSSIHVAVALQNAAIIATTSSNITPNQGHVHLYLDNRLIYMQYSLQQDVPVQPGVYSLKAEFVASDHFPFNPRVWSSVVVFTVKASG